MDDDADTARRFLELHTSERPLLLPNPWDLGSARDWNGSEIYDISLAAERVAVAADAAHAGPVHMVITARAENQLRKHKDLDDTIERLLAYQEAGADVLYAPGLRSVEQIGSVLEAVERPLNVLAFPGVPPVAELAKVGVSRVSVGAAFAFAAYGALVEAAQELRDTGTHGYLELARLGYYEGAREAFARG
jgi:2-methylisocitrate lyase-like PEP mutase family enzyme